MTIFPAVAIRLWRLVKSPVWKAAKDAVSAISKYGLLNQVAKVTERPAFCPRCGQIPDGDRRMDEARELAMRFLRGHEVTRRDLDLALAWHYWRSRA